MPFEQELFLNQFNAFLSGGSEGVFSFKDSSRIIRRGVRFKDVVMNRLGKHMEISIRANQEFLPRSEGEAYKKHISLWVKKLFDENHINVQLMLEQPVTMEVKKIVVNATNIQIILDAPAGSKERFHTAGRGTPVGIQYKNAQNSMAMFEQPLGTNDLDVLIRQWNKILSNPYLVVSAKDRKQKLIRIRNAYSLALVEYKSFRKTFEDNPHYSGAFYKKSEWHLAKLKADYRGYKRSPSLESVIDQINQFRQHNQFSVKEFRGDAAIVFHELRRIGRRTLQLLYNLQKDGVSVDPQYAAYFFTLAGYANERRRLISHLGSLDANKTLFPPVSDTVTRSILGVRIDKFIRVMSGMEWAYDNIKLRTLAALNQYYRYSRQLDRMEKRILKKRYRSGPAYSREHLRREVLGFNLEFEKPVANSIIGPDLWRRHNIMFWLASNIVILATSAFVLVKLGFAVHLWIPLVLAMGVLVLFYGIIPNSMTWWTDRNHYAHYKHIRTLAPQAEDPPDQEEPRSDNQLLLSMFTDRYIKKKDDSPQFVLRAREFFDIRVTQENDHYTFILMADSDIGGQDNNGARIVRQMQNDLLDYQNITFFAVDRNGKRTFIDPSLIKVSLHELGISLIIPDGNDTEKLAVFSDWKKMGKNMK